MRDFLLRNRRDVIAFSIPLLLYLLLVVLWSLVLRWPEDSTKGLSLQKDLLYYATWALAGLYAAVGTALTLRDTGLRRRERQRQLRMVLAGLAIPMVVGFVLEIVNSRFVLSLLPGMVHPMMQLVIATVMIAISASFSIRGAMLPGQIVNRAYIRFGLALMFIPTVGFIVHMPLSSDWSGPVHGVVLGNAMLHGVIWGTLYAGILGANMLERPAAAKPAARR